MYCGKCRQREDLRAQTKHRHCQRRAVQSSVGSSTTGGRAHSPSKIHSLLVSCRFLPIHETQKSKSATEDRKNDVTVWDPEPGPAQSTSLISLWYLTRHQCAFPLNTSSWVSVPSSTCTPHTSIWHRGATCHAGREHVVLPPPVIPPVASSLFCLAAG